jgi:peptidoglycan/LPS O-acetylase OafA/YrhL
VFHVTVMLTAGAGWNGERSPPAVIWPLFAGKLGVDLFFVLSGFLVLGSWHASQRRSTSLKDALVGFGKRRARRILPAFWLCIALLVLYRRPEWLASADGWRNIGLFATVQQFMDPTLPSEINTVTWSLTTEVHFYVLLPVLALVLGRVGRLPLVATLIAATVAWRLTHGGTGQEAEWILGRVDQFAAGMAASTLVREPDHPVVRFLRSRAGAAALSVGALYAIVPLGALQRLHKPLSFDSTFHAVMGLVCAGVLIRMCDGRTRPYLDGGPLAAVGTVSYSLYLWHWPVLTEASKHFGPRPLTVIGGLAVTAVVTVLSYRFVERPFFSPRGRATEASGSSPGRPSGPLPSTDTRSAR